MSERPTAAPAHWPYVNHRTLKQVDLEAAQDAERDQWLAAGERLSERLAQRTQSPAR
jgi:hypothetical protein